MTIVLGYDGTETADAALAEAARIAKRLEADVAVVFAYYISPLGGGDVHDYKAALEALATEQTSKAEKALAAEGVACSVHHVSGKPADAILAVAEETGATMIIVGSPSRSPLAAALLGSVVLNLVQRSPVPLLTVPA